MQHYDIIIVGSGLGGLECATLLSRAGKSVLVLERSNQPGGCMQSYRRAGYAFDTGLHYVGGLEPGQSLYHEFQTLGLLNLPWYRMDEQFDRVMLGDQEYCFSQGHDTFVDTLAQSFPDDREALDAYAKLLQTAPPETMDVSAYDYLHQHFPTSILAEVLAATSTKMELRRESLPLFSLLHGTNSYIESAWRLKGDGNLIVDCLVRQIRNAGGEVLCNAEVTELKENDGRLSQALCANGECYEADQFISDIHPQVLCGLIRESQHLKHVYRRRMASLENTTGMFTVSLRLKPCSVPYHNYNEYIYTDADVWAVTSRSEEKKEMSGIMVSSRVPEDRTNFSSQIDILTRMPWHECAAWNNTSVGHRGNEYRAMTEQKAKECIALASCFIPNLSSYVESCHISTPLTYRDYLASPEGSAFGVRNDYRRSMMTFMSVRTPIPNLLLTGQSIVLPGVEGVTKTAFSTCAEVLGHDYDLLK